MGSAAPQIAGYLAEWYRPEVTQQPLDDTVAKLDAVAAAMRVEGSLVKLLVTLAVPTDEVDLQRLCRVLARHCRPGVPARWHPSRAA